MIKYLFLILFMSVSALSCTKERAKAHKAAEPSQEASESFVIPWKAGPSTKLVEPLTDVPEEPQAPSPIPDGFPETDRYSRPYEACRAEIFNFASEKQLYKNAKGKSVRVRTKALVDYCMHRVYHSSRGNKIVSRIDGSQIHDRDRPTAWRFWLNGKFAGYIKPETCLYHVVDTKKLQPQATWELAREWPFKTKLTNKMKRAWLSSSPDYEQFGARGPIDNNAIAFKYLKDKDGCWDPAQLDRNDVSIAAHYFRSLAKCIQAGGCRTKNDVRKAWRK